MEYKRLGDIASYINGYAFKPEDRGTEGLPIIRIQDLTGNAYDLGFYNGDYPKRIEINNGDVLISWSASLGVYLWDKGRALLNQHIFKVVFDKCAVDKQYFIYAIQHKLKEMESKTHGATMKHIVKKDFDDTVIPFPSMEQQAEIASTLSKAANICKMHHHQLSSLDDLIKARFVEMFGDPFSNPLNWECISFKESSLRLSDGPFGSNLKSEHYSETGVRVIRLGNIGVGRFIDEDKSFIPPEHYEKLKKYTCHAGEIVIGTLGDPNLRACIIPKEIGIAVNKADCVHYIPDPSLLNTEFACQYVNCPETLLLAHGMIHGQTRSRVSSGQIAEMPIFIPPLELQNVFSDFVHQIDKSKSAIQKSLDKTQLLFDSLMQQYFG
ncbi:MAG: restriction endonuclease subunit S [Oscillospiraceae bacterium]|nr:restriction endonuclease subunit S [Oscillospiraceae bacterium]